MNPRLTVIEGPLKGQTISLAKGEEVSIGRVSDNSLRIGDYSVSRHHCLIKKDGDDYKINDLESLNGTFINDVPVKERRLEHGDRIQIGDSLLLFLQHEGEISPASNAVQLDDGAVAARSTIQLREQDALASMARDFHALLKISTEVNSLRGLRAIQERLLALIFEIVRADRGAILFASHNEGEFEQTFGVSRTGASEQPIRVSQTVVQQVLRDGVALSSNDLTTSESLSAAGSLIDAGVRALLCVPLTIFGKIIGVIYLDTGDPSVKFNEDYLRLMTAIAGIAAVALENARHLEWLESENARLRTDKTIEHNMIGESRQMREVYEFVAKAAGAQSTVLIKGESGTGKELAARAIHQNSPRAGHPFIAINCAALTETLLESELFGHEKGAFTGAITQKKGMLEVADGGTLFLDEIAEMVPALQAKLLRVLQEREFTRVGGTRTIKMDVRLIAATNRNLDEAVKNGGFRQDLFYRLNVLSLVMPSLRERLEDVPLLASYFVAKYSQKCHRHVRGLSAEARSCLLHYHWPGNVRELENTIERALVLGNSDIILPEDLPEVVLETESPASDALAKYHAVLTETKKQLVLKAMEQAKGDYSEAAKSLGLHPNYLYRLIRNLQIKDALKK